MNNNLLLKQIEEILKTNTDSSYYHITAMSNISALLYDNMKDLNWLGFYILENDNLLLGPFQGKIACSKIRVGKGVCGTAVAENQTQRVADVHQFLGHIACDSASNSEIVVPIHAEGTIVGVLDIDSPVFERFDEEDQMGLEEFVKILEQGCKW